MSSPWLVVLVVLLTLVASASCAAFVVWLVRQLRQVSRRRPLRPTAPRVVLVHGLLGFDEMRVAGRRIEYFRGVAGHLQAQGHEVHCPRVPPVASIEARADRLAEYIKQLPGAPIHIIAHSLGGLDARYAVAHLGLEERVASLTTIGTPHRGTPLADLGSVVLESVGIRRLLRLFALDAEGFFALSTKRMASFNERVPDAEGVAYASVVGVVPPGGHVHPLLAPGHKLLEQRGEPSDGLVPARSQVWGEVLAEVEADHWGQVGWGNGDFDAAALYLELLQELRVAA